MLYLILFSSLLTARVQGVYSTVDDECADTCQRDHDDYTKQLTDCLHEVDDYAPGGKCHCVCEHHTRERCLDVKGTSNIEWTRSWVTLTGMNMATVWIDKIKVLYKAKEPARTFTPEYVEVELDVEDEIYPQSHNYHNYATMVFEHYLCDNMDNNNVGSCSAKPTGKENQWEGLDFTRKEGEECWTATYNPGGGDIYVGVMDGVHMFDETSVEPSWTLSGAMAALDSNSPVIQIFAAFGLFSLVWFTYSTLVGKVNEFTPIQEV